MKNEQERMKKLLKGELDKEADQIIQEVEADETLQNTVFTEDMEAGLRMKIAQYEAEKAVYEKSSEEDKEALRIGREIQIQRANIGDGGYVGDEKPKKVVRFRKRRRMAFALVAVVVVLVMGLGVTSIGGKPFISDFFDQMLAGRENVNITSSNDDSVLPAENDKEEQAYQNIKDEFGFDAVQMWYLPEEAKFKECIVDKNLEEAFLLYEYEEGIIEYRILTNHINKSVGYDMEDKLLEERTETVSDVPIIVKRYKIQESGQEQFVLHFEYNKINYILTAAIKESEIQKIIDNLKFL